MSKTAAEWLDTAIKYENEAIAAGDHNSRKHELALNQAIKADEAEHAPGHATPPSLPRKGE